MNTGSRGLQQRTLPPSFIPKRSEISLPARSARGRRPQPRAPARPARPPPPAPSPGLGPRRRRLRAALRGALLPGRLEVGVQRSLKNTHGGETWAPPGPRERGGREQRSVLPSPSRSRPGSTEPRRSRTSRPRRTPHTEVAAFSPRARPLPAPLPSPSAVPWARPGRTAPLSRAGEPTRGSAQAPAAPAHPPQPPGRKRAPPSESDRRGRAAGEPAGAGTGDSLRVRARGHNWEGGGTSECELQGRWRRVRDTPDAERRADGEDVGSFALRVLAPSRTSGPRLACPIFLLALCPEAAAARDEPLDSGSAGADEVDDPCPRF